MFYVFHKNTADVNILSIGNKLPFHYGGQQQKISKAMADEKCSRVCSRDGGGGGV